MDIFSRNIPTVSPEDQKILSTKTAFVAGCGGLGGFIIEYLVRLGVGHIIACDADVFSESNLNRQILSTVGTLGKSKVREAEKRARSIVPDIRFDGFEVFLDEANACELMKGADIAMDALDNPSSRVILAKAAAETGIPMVHGAVGGQHRGNVVRISFSKDDGDNHLGVASFWLAVTNYLYDTPSSPLCQ